MSVPRVGQSLAASAAELGAYASVSTPADLKTVSYSEGATLSELTINRETTVAALSAMLLSRSIREDTERDDPVSHSPSFGLLSIHAFTAIYGQPSAPQQKQRKEYPF